MKKSLFTLLFLCAISITLSAQRLELTGFSGIMLSGDVRTDYGEGKIESNANYGGILDYEISRGTMLELMYNRKDTRMSYYDYYTLIPSWDEYDISVEYYHIGVQHEVGENRIKPFGAFTLGFSRYHVKNGYYDDAYRFSLAPGLGFKVYLTEQIGLRFQGRLLMPLEFYGFGIFYGTSSGVSSGVSFNVPVFQGDFTAGLFISL